MEYFIHQNSSVITTNKGKSQKGSWLKLRATHSGETHVKDVGFRKVIVANWCPTLVKK